jgi:hypothetical protein
MEHFGSQREEALLTEALLSFADSSQVISLPVDAGLDGQYGVGESWLSQAYETIRLRANTTRRRWLVRARKSGTLSFIRILWAAPWSVWGLAIGGLGLLTGAKVRRTGRILEFWGGVLPLFLKYFPFVAGSPVATFGHVVVGRSTRHLDACRPHQLIHVQQYERWGALFVPVYVGWWVVLLCCGKRPYYDNPFEREAYDKAPFSWTYG